MVVMVRPSGPADREAVAVPGKSEGVHDTSSPTIQSPELANARKKLFPELWGLVSVVAKPYTMDCQVFPFAGSLSVIHVKPSLLVITAALDELATAINSWPPKVTDCQPLS